MRSGVPVPPPSFVIGGVTTGFQPIGALLGAISFSFSQAADIGDAGDTLSTTVPEVFALGTALAIDIESSGGALWLQFGGDTLAADFDVALAAKRPATDFGDQLIGAPAGSTQYGIMATVPGITATVDTVPLESALFGGETRSMKCTVTGSTLGCTMAANVTNAPIFMAMRVRSSNIGSAGANHFFGIAPAADTNTGVFVLRKNSGAASDTWAALYKATAANTAVANTPASAIADAWTTVFGWFTLDGASDVCPQVGMFDDTNFDAISAVTDGAHDYAGPQTRVIVGGIVNATGQGFMLADDEFVRGIVIAGGTMPTHLQAQELTAEDCDLWEKIVAGWGLDTANIAASIGVDPDGNLRDFVSGRILAELTGFTAGTFAAAAYAGPYLRQPNSVVTQDTDGIEKIPYTDVASGLTTIPHIPSCRWLAYSEHAVNTDCASAAGASAVQKAAGSAIVYSRGGSVQMDVIAPGAGNAGTLDLTGLDHRVDLYVPAESGLAYTVTSGTVSLAASSTTGTISLTTDRSWVMFKPNTGANRKVVLGAVGAGGQLGFGTYGEGDLDSEYTDIAAYLASIGYIVVFLAFADEGEVFPWPSFHYPERTAEFLEFGENEIAAIVGDADPDVILLGHSGGGATMQASSGLVWTDTTPVTGGIRGPTIMQPDGGGTVLGALVLSGQGLQTDQKNMTILSTAWDEITLPHFYFTNVDDSGGVGGGDPLDRLTGFANGDTEAQCFKMQGLTGGHLYAGALSPATIDAGNDKRRSRIPRTISMNVWGCICDHLCGVQAATDKLITGWDDRHIVVYDYRNLVQPELDMVPLVRETPTLRFFGQLHWGAIDDAQQILTEEHEFLAANTYGWYSSLDASPGPEGAELDAMRALNPDMKFYGYGNSSASPNGPAGIAALCEADRLHTIQHYREGTLQTALSDTTGTTVRVTSAGTNGIKASTESGDFSTGTHSGAGDSYVTWIAVVPAGQPLENAEIMKVTAITPGTPNVLTVQRGFGGSTAATHAANELVFCPLYQADSHPDGTGVNDPRYSLIPDSDETMALSCIGPFMAGIVNDHGRNGGMLDLMSPSFSEQRNAFGVLTTPWNFDTGAVMTELERLEKRKTQMANYKALIPAADSWMANNGNQDFATADGNSRELLSEGHVDVLQWEGLWAKTGTNITIANVRNNMRCIAECMQQGYGVVVSAKPLNAYGYVPADHTSYDAAMYRDWILACLLWEPSNENAFFSFNFLIDPGVGPIGTGNWQFNIPEFMYNDIGVPVDGDQADGGPGDADDTASLNPLKVPNWDGRTGAAPRCNSYDREWTRAYFIANPVTVSDTVATTLPVGRHWRDFADNLTYTTCTLGASSARAFYAYDFEVAAATTDVGALIGTVVGDHGDPPYTYALAAPSRAFEIDGVSGEIRLKNALTHVPNARFILSIEITNSLDVTETVERLIVTS